MDYTYTENVLTAKEFLKLGECVGWGSADEKVEPKIEKALRNSLFNIKVNDGDIAIGMGRLVGDGIITWYIQDVVVMPEYQGKGIGREIVKRLIGYAEQQSFPEKNVIVRLTSAIGKKTSTKNWDLSVVRTETMDQVWLLEKDRFLVHL